MPTRATSGLFSYLPGRISEGSRLEDFWALKGVNLEVQSGTMLGLIGRNGSGKSTLLKIMAGIQSPSAGTVQTRGRVAAMLELGAGFHEELSGMENIFLNGAILGLSKSEIMKLLPSILEFSDLGDFIETPIKHYSSGMKARLGFSIAVHVNPDIMLIDEVMSVGDMEFQSKCVNRINDFRQKGKTIILVTHEIEVASYLCDRMVWMEEGLVYRDGPATDIVHEYRSQVFDTESEIEEIPELPPGKDNPEITFVRFLDQNGSPSLQFQTGEDMILEIGFHTRGRLVKNPWMHVIVNRKDNVTVTEIDSREYGLYAESLYGQGEFRIRFEPLLLLKAVYDVDIRLHERDAEEMIVASRKREDSFEVTTGRLHNPGIVADVPCRWDLRSL